MRGDNFAKPPLQRRWQAAGLTVESRANDVRPYGFSFRKRVNNSSALSGISSMRGDDFAKPPLQRRWQAAGLTEESRANDVRPYRFLFLKRMDNSSALSGISSMRGDNFAKPPLQRRWQAAGLTVESRANIVRPYGFSFRKGWTTPLPCRASPLGKVTLAMFHVKHCAAGAVQNSSG